MNTHGVAGTPFVLRSAATVHACSLHSCCTALALPTMQRGHVRCNDCETELCCAVLCCAVLCCIMLAISESCSQGLLHVAAVNTSAAVRHYCGHPGHLGSGHNPTLHPGWDHGQEQQVCTLPSASHAEAVCCLLFCTGGVKSNHSAAALGVSATCLPATDYKTHDDCLVAILSQMAEFAASAYERNKLAQLALCQHKLEVLGSKLLHSCMEC